MKRVSVVSMENTNTDATYYQPSFFDTHAGFTPQEEEYYPAVEMEFLNADFRINNADEIVETLEKFTFFDSAGRDRLFEKEEEIDEIGNKM